MKGMSPFRLTHGFQRIELNPLPDAYGAVRKFERGDERIIWIKTSPSREMVRVLASGLLALL
jgi:hypothetical protein